MLVLKMDPHPVHQFLPEFVSALLVNAFIADYGKLARPRRHENQHGVSLLCLFHPQEPEFSLRVVEGVAVQFSPLHVNANLARRLRLRFLDGAHDSIMIELVEKYFRTHEIYQLPLEPPPPNPPPPPPNPLNPPPDDELLDQPPPLPDQPPMKGPPKLE